MKPPNASIANEIDQMDIPNPRVWIFESELRFFAKSGDTNGRLDNLNENPDNLNGSIQEISEVCI